MNIPDLLSKLPHIYPLMGLVVLGGVVIVMIVRLGLHALNWRRLWKRKSVFLELTPPALTNRTAHATQQLFSVIHGQRAARSWQDRLLRCNAVITAEIVSTRAEGVQYIIQVERRLAESVSQAIMAYLPDAKIAEVQDFLPRTSDTQITEFKQTGHYAFPLAQHIALEEHDPVAFLTGAMTKLAADESMTLQLVVTPVRLREASILAHKILGNEDLLSHLSGRKIPLWSNLMNLIVKALFSVTGAVGEAYHGSTKQSYQASQHDAQQQLQVAKRMRPARTLSAFELELMESIHRKLSQPLFRVSIRVSVTMSDPQAAKERLNAIKSSLQSYSVPSYQALKPKIDVPFLRKYRWLVFLHCMPSLFTKRDCVLSASELASLYHFPLNEGSKTDNLKTSLSRTLAAPISLKQDHKLAMLLGMNKHHGLDTPIGLTSQERERHAYIVGGTGSGKTTMMLYQMIQSLQNGEGFAFIDPHGDAAETLLRYVPKSRIKDVVYFNPDDLDYPIGLNLLELTPGLTGNELKREKDLVTESVISVFRKIFSEEDTGGHRIEYVLRNATQTALTVEDATLFTIYELLNDPKYRKLITKSLDDKYLVQFWKNELGKAGDMQKVKMAAGITAKIGRFLFSASAKQILEQPKSTIDFDDIINSGKILICNFSKGLIGEDTSELFGITVLAKLQLAALRRARIQQTERRPFYLYVDEFQNFATASFVQMLSESRKYKLFMTMAEQSTSQQDDRHMMGIILANVGTVVCFRTGNPDDERTLLPLFSPYIEQGEIANLPAFNFYARLGAVTSQEPLSGQTLLLGDLKDGTGEETARVVVETSRTIYAKHRRARDNSPDTSVATTPKKSIKATEKKGKMLDID